ncbi:hypothetical protein [Clostridium perfringens]|uniref:hypothetical protein n=1 Tax=Clostridium perfringens TaxID=1502 RepID=UPI0013E2FD99|nr:hypothetical protein [Clostridium perfringens]NGT67940.1 hypothetical protein [Clostridium perfringens]
MSSFFEVIINNYRENKAYWIFEFIIFIGTIFFILKLNSYNKILIEIQSRYTNKIIKAIEVSKEPSYFYYLLSGGAVIAILIGYIFFVFNKIHKESIFIVLINIILLIVFFRVYWNPILATFATLLVIGGIFGMANANT